MSMDDDYVKKLEIEYHIVKLIQQLEQLTEDELTQFYWENTSIVTELVMKLSK